jgi:hypothetical protein
MARLESTRELLEDDAEQVSSFLYERGYTDGLPVIPPTETRVERMLAATRRDPGESLGVVPPANGQATVEKIAINAVMAGCRPEYLPVVLAALEAVLTHDFDLAALQTTTNPLTPLIVVNGPIRRRVELNCGGGVMGPGWQANATIGRALRLLLLNLGGAVADHVDKCTQGFAGKYTLCIGENEEESPWPPFHVTRGLDAAADTVTVVGVNASVNIHDSSGDWEDVLKTITGSLATPGTADVVDPFSTPVLLLNPNHARLLDSGGYDRERLAEHLFQHARLPADGLSRRRELLRRQHGDELFSIDGSVPFLNDPGRLLVVVAGGIQGGHSCYLPNGHYGHAVTVPIAD